MSSSRLMTCTPPLLRGEDGREVRDPGPLHRPSVTTTTLVSRRTRAASSNRWTRSVVTPHNWSPNGSCIPLSETSPRTQTTQETSASQKTRFRHPADPQLAEGLAWSRHVVQFSNRHSQPTSPGPFQPRGGYFMLLAKPWTAAVPCRDLSAPCLPPTSPSEREHPVLSISVNWLCIVSESFKRHRLPHSAMRHLG